jgi:hypothetical protein
MTHPYNAHKENEPMFEYSPLPKELQLPVQPLKLSPEKEQELNLMLEIEQCKFMIECISEWENVDRCKKRELLREQRAKLGKAERALAEFKARVG